MYPPFIILHNMIDSAAGIQLGGRKRNYIRCVSGITIMKHSERHTTK